MTWETLYSLYHDQHKLNEWEYTLCYYLLVWPTFPIPMCVARADAYGTAANDFTEYGREIAVQILTETSRSGQISELPAAKPAEVEGYALRQDTTTSFGRSYSGPAQVAVVKFNTGPEQTDFMDNWYRDNLVDDAVNAVKDQGGDVIRVQLWRDKSPTFYTKWKVLITARVPQGAAAPGKIGFPWLAWAVVVASILLVSWVTAKVLESVRDIIWGPGGGTKPILGIPWLGWLGIGIVAIYGFSEYKKWKSAGS